MVKFDFSEGKEGGILSLAPFSKYVIYS